MTTRFSMRRGLLAALPHLLWPALLCPALVYPGGPAEAHAILVESQPPDRGRVAAGTVTFRLRFNSRIDRGRSRLILTGPAEAGQAGAGPAGAKSVPAIEAEGPPDIVTAKAVLPPGAYVLRWQVLATDGHITRGDVAFTVTER